MRAQYKYMPSAEQCIEMYKRMLKIREFEYKALKHCTERLNRGPLHLYVGEEGTAVGACMALEPGDYITSTHRGHGHCIAMGGDLKRMLAEIVGRSTGTARGKAVRCTSPTWISVSSARTESWARAFRSRSAPERATQARSTRASTWHRFGIFP